MRKFLSLITVICLITAIFSSCGNKDVEIDNTSPTSNEESTTQNTESTKVSFNSTDDDMFTSRDSNAEYDETSAVKITLNGNTATSTDNSVKISKSIITITKEASYIVSGTLNNGSIVVDASDSDKIQLVLKNADISSSTSAPIYIKEADKVFVTLVGENALSSGETYEQTDDSNIDSAIFSKQDLTFNGDGALTVSAPAGHAIVGKDDVVFTDGSYTLTASSHAIQANDSVRIKNAVISADSGKDGIHCENSDDSEKGFVYISSGEIKIECEGDGISAGSFIQINDGTFEVLTGGGYENGEKQSSDNFGQFGGGGGMHGGMHGGAKPSGDRGTMNTSTSTTTDTSASDSSTSMKGIKSVSDMLISGGTFKIDSADDAIHSNTSLTINGGTFEIASGDDAVHAEESLTVTDGKFNISQSYEGLEALNITLSGGEISLVASDDGLNAAGGTDSSGFGGRDEMFGGGPMGGKGGMSSNSNGSIIISGGTLHINASGDGIDANGTLEISGGFTTVVGPTQGDTATLDYDKSATITGGTFIGTGASNMAQSFSDSSQGVIAISAGTQSANTKITLKDSKGNEIISHSPELSYQVIILSTPEMKSGETYTLTVGTQSAEFEAE